MQGLLEEKKKISEIPREQRYPNRPLLQDFFNGFSDKQERAEK